MRNKIIEGLNNRVFVYEDDHNLGIGFFHWKIKEID